MKNNAYVLKLGLLALALLLMLTGSPTAQAGGFNVDSLVTFTPLPSTYRSTTNTTGCPAGYAGKFTFTAQLTNRSDSPAMPGLDVFVQTLTNGNLLLDPQTNAILGGQGAVMEVPEVGQYVDGLLSADETVQVPFALCLRTLQSFQFFVDVLGIVTELVSVNRTGTNGGNDGSYVSTVSADGRFVAFSSDANDLVANDSDRPPTDPLAFWQRDVFVRDLQTGTTTLVSVNRFGTNSGNGASGGGRLSADGRFVAFTSEASDLVTNDTSFVKQQDVFVRDLQTGTTTLVSVNRFGTNSGNNLSQDPVLSADGRFVVFQSFASDLVANDTNGTGDVFMRDLQTGVTTLVSVNRSGINSGSGNSGGFLRLSPNGRFVGFVSSASDLVANDTNGIDDVFVRDLEMGTTTLVSVNRFGTNGGNEFSVDPELSADGRSVAFRSYASDLVANDTNGTSDIFVRDLQMGVTTLVSVNRMGTSSGNGISQIAGISADGRFVVFESIASDLVANDTNGTWDVFVRDLQTGTTTLMSINRAGTGSGNDFSRYPVLSATGRFVAFYSAASDLVARDTNGWADVFVRDLQTGTTTLVSVNQAGTDSGNNGSGLLASGLYDLGMSADGRIIVFTSEASDLVANDTNGKLDAFVRPVQQ